MTQQTEEVSRQQPFDLRVLLPTGWNSDREELRFHPWLAADKQEALVVFNSNRVASIVQSRTKTARLWYQADGNGREGWFWRWIRASQVSELEKDSNWSFLIKPTLNCYTSSDWLRRLFAVPGLFRELLLLLLFCLQVLLPLLLLQ